jgi:integrase
MIRFLEHLIATIFNRLRDRRRGAWSKGGSLVLGHRVMDERVTRSEVRLSTRERMRHVVVVGKTGSGKSYLLRSMSEEDIARDRGFIYLDLHGDATPFLLRTINARERREHRHLSDKVILIDPADPIMSIGLNPLQQETPDFVAIAEVAEILKWHWGLDHFGARTDELLRNALTEATLNRDIEVLRHLLYWAVDEGFLTVNPVARVRLPKQRREPRPILSLAEEAKILDAAAPHLRQLIIAALDSGMRRGELLTQRAEHIDLTRRVLAVTHSKNHSGEARGIPLIVRLTHLLANLHRTNPEGLVFSFKGRPIERIKTAWRGTVRRSGIRYFRFHDLRHTFNTRLMEAGVMQDVRKALMGHSSGEEINSLYTHVELPVKREAIRKLESWVEAERKRQQAEPEGEPHAEPEPIP